LDVILFDKLNASKLGEKQEKKIKQWKNAFKFYVIFPFGKHKAHTYTGKNENSKDKVLMVVYV
jgi:hypothetical protein